MTDATININVIDVETYIESPMSVVCIIDLVNNSGAVIGLEDLVTQI